MHTLYRDAAGPGLAPHGSVVCIGAFDGVHRGHRCVLDHARTRAAELGLTPIAISFEPIPREFFARGTGVPRLSSARDKIQGLIDAGMCRILLLRFNAALAGMTAEHFIESVLVGRLNAREVLVGEGFAFGHARAGNIALLQQSGARYGFRAREMGVVAQDGERVSSSRIRRDLANGDFDEAARLLGRRFAIGGHVVHGKQLGRKLGYPTANLRLGQRLSPVQGIFAVRVHGVAAMALPAVASLGVRPTVNGTEPLLEAHLFNFDGDLYGKRIEIEFVEKLRDEEKFPDLDALVRQMHDDAARARRILGVATRVAAGA